MPPMLDPTDGSASTPYPPPRQAGPRCSARSAQAPRLDDPVSLRLAAVVRPQP
uniref:Uncharacterized protein n=1 Tax=Arundo donax TaxID=35708 RepID=A0A0A8ZSN0_ARUDO